MSTTASLRSAFFTFMVFGDALQNCIVYRNLQTVKTMNWTKFAERHQYWTFTYPKISPHTYRKHRDREKIQSFGRTINCVVGLCIRCAKFSTNYYNVVWRMTDGFGFSPIGRVCMFAAIDSLSGVAQDAITAFVEVLCDVRSVQVKETIGWLLTRPINAIEKAASCYLVIFCLDRSDPLMFHAIWTVLELLGEHIFSIEKQNSTFLANFLIGNFFFFFEN